MVSNPGYQDESLFWLTGRVGAGHQFSRTIFMCYYQANTDTRPRGSSCRGNETPRRVVSTRCSGGDWTRARLQHESGSL